MSKDKAQDWLKNLHDSFGDDVESARLKLALIKENATYRKLFEENVGNYRSASLDAIKFAFFIDACLREHGISNPPDFGLDTLAVLDPSQSVPEEPDAMSRRILSQLFFSPAIRGVTPTGYHECPGSPPIPLRLLAFRGRRVEPFERLLLLDLRKKRKQIERQFRAFLDAVEARREEAPEKYEGWEADRTRAREESWQHLRVWKLRREKKGYAAIARITGMTVGAVKMSFYKAHKIIEGFPYDREKYKLKHWNLRECATCKEHPDRGGACKELCPDAKARIGIPEDIYLHQEKDPEMNEKMHIHAEWLTKESRELQSEENEQD